jgi:pimeloyl-ACP methyl ester carboxylesterase
MMGPRGGDEEGDEFVARILLVHGAWQGPWCWDGFAARLRDQGHDARTVELRGHDGPPGRIWHRIRSYVEDVRTAAAEFPEPPVPVGHSMGGLVVQKYLERNPAPRAVLMASVPVRGALGATLRFARRHPGAFARTNLTLSLRPVVGTPALAREMLFSRGTPDDVVDAFAGRIQDESYPAYIGMIAAVPRPKRIAVPVLVLGGDRDGIFSVAEAHRTAAAYRTAAVIVPGMGHQMMIEPGWEAVADRVSAFAGGG